MFSLRKLFTQRAPVRHITIGAPNSAINNDTECWQKLTELKFKLNRLNTSLFNIRETLTPRDFLSRYPTFDQIDKIVRQLHYDISELLNDMRMEETTIGTLPEVDKRLDKRLDVASGRRRKVTRRRRRRQGKH